MQKINKMPIYVFGTIGLITTIVGYNFSMNWEKERVSNKFKNEARKALHAIKDNIEHNLSNLDSIKSFYGASQHVERLEFKEFTSYILANYNSVYALEWIPRIKYESRQEFIQEAVTEGLVDFQITEKDESGNLIKAKERPEYFPVYYVEPLENNIVALGYDLASNKTRQLSLNKARDSGVMVATSRIKLVQEREDQDGFLVANPVYRNGAPLNTVEQRREFLAGYVLGVFRLSRMFGSVLENVDYNNINVHLYDETDPQNSELLYSYMYHSDSAGNRIHYEDIKDVSQREMLSSEIAFSVGERAWRLKSIASENYGIIFNYGQPILILVSGLLITLFFVGYLKLSIERRVRTERSMDSMIESMQEGVIMMDHHENILVINPMARKVLGIADQEENIDKVMIEKVRYLDLQESIQKSREKEAVVQKEITMPGNDKQIFSCSICPVQSKGKSMGTAIILRDISVEKEVDAAKTEFISTVSHELRTPLATTKEGLSLIADKIAGDITEKQEMILNTAQDNIARLTRLINNLLDISKIEAGKMELRNTKIDVTTLTKKILADFEISAKDKGLNLLLNYPDLPIDVFADRDKVIQVFTNLINNALKFTTEGYISISAQSSGDFIEFTVADTGIGISKENLKRTFGKFQQFGRASGQGEKGTGLGLSIAKGIVEMHGGNIWVESELNEGTKFIFTLPKYTDDLPLNEFVNHRINEAKKTAEHLSLVMIHLSGVDNGKKSLPKEEQQQHLKTIENLLSADLHRENDSTFRDARRCAAVIANCDKGRVGIVCERIKGTMSRFIEQEDLTGKIDLEVGYALYPDDAHDSVELLKKVRAV